VVLVAWLVFGPVWELLTPRDRSEPHAEPHVEPHAGRPAPGGR
jgi:hypothetical protein